jgi:hypothetical protein
VKDAPYNAAGDGVTDDTSAIQSAVSACGQDQVIYLPAGTYKLTNALEIFQKGIVLRGAGPELTTLRLESNTNSILYFYAWSSSTTTNIISGFEKDSDMITVDNAGSFNAGDYILMDQVNDGLLVTKESYSGECTWCSRWPTNGDRAMGQMAKIISKNGNALTLDRPFYYSFDLSYSPQIIKLSSNPVINGGVEDLKLDDQSPNGTSVASILFSFCINCWIKNVESSNAGKAHVKFSSSYGCVLRDSYLHEAHRYDSGSGYGILLMGQSTDNLIENNVFYYFRHSMVMEGGGTGNVFGYNYTKDPYTSEDAQWLSEDALTHGAHPYMNLFEGNIVSNFANDWTHGSSSHNTYFRNQVTRQRSIPTVRAIRAIDVQKRNTYMNFVGNILGYSGMSGNYDICGASCSSTLCSANPTVWRMGCTTPSSSENPPVDSNVGATLLRHGNYDYISQTTKWDSDIQDHTFPNSYYFSSKPGFFGNLAWPPIGPDVNPMNGMIPAKARFEGQSYPYGSVQPDITPPAQPTGLTVN